MPKGHVLVCGWGEKAFRIVSELRAAVLKEKPTVVLVGESVGELPVTVRHEEVSVVAGDPTRDETLLEADVEHADTAIILADPSAGALTDARSILVALAIESINPSVHTAVEVVDSANLAHFSRTEVNEVVSLADLSEKLLAQAALNHGVTHFYQELMLFQEDGNEFYRVTPAPEWCGRGFGELYRTLLPRRVVVIGVQGDEGPRLNPPPEYAIRKGDDLWVIAFEKPTREELACRRAGE